MTLSRAAVFTVAASLAFSAWAGEMLREPQRIGADVPARMATLQAEIAALDARARGDSPEFEAELREWEAKMAEPAEWSGHARQHAVPERIAKILALEPSERTDDQRAALVQYFRPRSKIVAAAQRAAAAKRAELVKLQQKPR